MPNATQTIVLQPGETFSLPANATVVYISDSNIDSTCPLPELEEYGCYSFIYGLDENDDQHTMSTENARIVSLNVGSTVYPIDTVAFALPENNLKVLLEDALPQALFDIQSVNINTTFNHTSIVAIYFKTFPSLIADMELELTGSGYGDLFGGTPIYLKPVAVECDPEFFPE